MCLISSLLFEIFEIHAGTDLEVKLFYEQKYQDMFNYAQQIFIQEFPCAGNKNLNALSAATCRVLNMPL